MIKELLKCLESFQPSEFNDIINDYATTICLYRSLSSLSQALINRIVFTQNCDVKLQIFDINTLTDNSSIRIENKSSFDEISLYKITTLISKPLDINNQNQKIQKIVHFNEHFMKNLQYILINGLNLEFIKEDMDESELNENFKENENPNWENVNLI